MTTFLSRSYYTGDGTTTVYPINWPSGWAKDEHVEVYVDGNLFDSTLLTISSSPAQVTFLVAPSVDQAIIIKRRTPKTYPADFSQKVVIKSSNLQKDFDWIQLWAEEADDLITITDPQAATEINPDAYLTYQEMVTYVNAVLSGVTNEGDGDTIIVNEYGRFYRQVSGVTVGQTVFNLLYAYVPNSNTMSVYLNGELQIKDVDYEETTNLQITFLKALADGVDLIQFVWSKTITAIPTNVYVDRITVIKTNIAGEDTIQIPYDPGNIDVFLNGVKLVRTVDFEAIDGANVILATPIALADDIIEVMAFAAFTVSNHYTKVEVYAKDEVYAKTENYSSDETYTKAEIEALIAGSSQAVFVGAIIGNPTQTIKTGYLECNGAAVNRVTYADLFAEIGTSYGIGNGINTFNLPDYRGEFLRGWDHGRGVDAGRNLGSLQSDEIGSHSHPYNSGTYMHDDWGGGNPGVMFQQDGTQTGLTGGNETRPRNVSIMWLIKY